MASYLKEHINVMLKKVYAKIVTLRRLKRLVPANSLLLSYRSFLLMNKGKSTNYESILRMVVINALEHRSKEQSLTISFECFKEDGPCYVANLFKPRVTPHNRRGTGLNVVQISSNRRFLHGLYRHLISRVWNQLPSVVMNAPNVSSIRRLSIKLNFTWLTMQ